MLLPEVGFPPTSTAAKKPVLWAPLAQGCNSFEACVAREHSPLPRLSHDHSLTEREMQMPVQYLSSIVLRCCRFVTPMRSLALTSVAGLMIVGVACFCQAQQSQQGQQGRQVSLKVQLTAGLKARTSADKAFINKVVTQVESGKLPRRLVDSTFLWARKKAEAKSSSRALRPMVYFQPGLLARTRMLGIKL